jgi:hypothetical protein
MVEYAVDHSSLVVGLVRGKGKRGQMSDLPYSMQHIYLGTSKGRLDGFLDCLETSPLPSWVSPVAYF